LRTAPGLRGGSSGARRAHCASLSSCRRTVIPKPTAARAALTTGPSLGADPRPGPAVTAAGSEHAPLAGVRRKPFSLQTIIPHH
jgi:hypothetical protein